MTKPLRYSCSLPSVLPWSVHVSALARFEVESFTWSDAAILISVFCTLCILLYSPTCCCVNEGVQAVMHVLGVWGGGWGGRANGLISHMVCCSVISPTVTYSMDLSPLSWFSCSSNKTTTVTLNLDVFHMRDLFALEPFVCMVHLL